MLDLFDEFVALVDALEKARLPYAVCGGLAMAIHGLPRATIDVDLLVPINIAGSGQDQDDIKRLQEVE